jgi:hypothetical protein
LKQHFDNVEWRTYEDHLRCTSAKDVVAYIVSIPPGSHATPEQLRRLTEEIEKRISDGDGVFDVVKESGVFLARCSD